MAAKLVFVLLAVAFMICLAVIVSYRYFDKQAQRKHEKEIMREEQRNELDEQLVEMAERDTGQDIDAELEREGK